MCPIEDSYRAIPTIIDDDSGIVPNETGNYPEFDGNNNNTKQDHIETITSDSDLSLVNCYDVENAKVYRKSSDGSEKELFITVNTEGLVYKPISDEINEIQIDVNDVSSANISIEFDSKGPVHIPEVFEKVETKPEIQTHTDTEELSYVESRKEQIPEVKPRQTKVTPIAQKRSKKSDNTLIRKIYSDPVVRNFALSNREEIPVDYHETAEILVSTPKTPKISEMTFELSPINVEQFEKIEKTPTETINTMDNFSLELSSDNEILQRQHYIDQDPEITQLKQKRLVANRLGEFSKSFPNLSKIQQIQHETHDNRNVDVPKSKDLKHQSFVSVKDLKKKFESNEAINKSKPVHSLTARSISKPIREKLKNEDNITRTFDRIVGSPEFRNVEEETINTNQ